MGKDVEKDMSGDVADKPQDLEQASGRGRLMTDLHKNISAAVNIADSLVVATEGESSAREVQLSDRSRANTARSAAMSTIMGRGSVATNGFAALSVDDEWMNSLAKAAETHAGQAFVGLNTYFEQKSPRRGSVGRRGSVVSRRSAGTTRGSMTG